MIVFVLAYHKRYSPTILTQNQGFIQIKNRTSVQLNTNTFYYNMIHFKEIHWLSVCLVIYNYEHVLLICFWLLFHIHYGPYLKMYPFLFPRGLFFCNTHIKHWSLEGGTCCVSNVRCNLKRSRTERIPTCQYEWVRD